MLKNKNFLVLWLGQLATIFGNRFSDVAIPLIVLELTGSPLQAALVAVCMQAPSFLFALPAGQWIEGKLKKYVAIGAESISFLVMATLAFLVWEDGLTTGVLAVGLFILGVSTLYFRIAFSAMIPGIVGRENLLRANTYFEGADAVSTFAGPVLAGGVLTLYGTAMALSIDALTYLLSLFGVILVVFKEKNQTRRIKTKVIAEYKLSLKSIRFLFANPYQRFISLQHILLNFTTVTVTLTVIFLTDQTLNFTPFEIGIVLSGAGIGNIIGVWLMVQVEGYSWRRLYSTLLIISGLGLVLVFSGLSVWLMALGMLIFDGALSMAFVVNGSARQAVTPDAFLARLAGGSILLSGIVVVSGQLFSGSISEAVSPVIPLIICSILLLTGGLYALRFRYGRGAVSTLTPVHSGLENK
ncbi:MFS transporter [Jeotgalibacillus aurantiacus]|uniref:MFS transporter n=1 Tax=Jeotgalibacillus aurantiacus TaxID=2763266 RepID=UPI001D0A647C|nr:MFS transporter [Jeotgalibacillus aurantiacus]